MIQLTWVVAGVIIGMLLSTVFIPPTRKVPTVPSPHDADVYHTETGCIRLRAVEVPCTQDTESWNLVASLTKK